MGYSITVIDEDDPAGASRVVVPGSTPVVPSEAELLNGLQGFNTTNPILEELWRQAGYPSGQPPYGFTWFGDT